MYQCVNHYPLLFKKNVSQSFEQCLSHLSMSDYSRPACLLLLNAARKTRITTLHC